MTEEPIITPHPEVESLSNSELRDALADADERLETLHKLPSEDRDPMIEPWLVQERMIILAELRRRYAYSRSSDSSQQFANFTSDYRNPLSEVKFEREVNLSDLQTKAIEKGEQVVSFLPVLGQDKFIVKGWSHILAGYPKTGKTELIVRLIAEWPEEKILYFTEEPEGVWEARLRELPKTYQHVKLYFGLGVSPLEIQGRIVAGDETVVILDTVRNLLALRDEKDNSEVARALIPFIAASRSKKQTLIALHHDRKGGGEHGEAIAGGHAFLGVIDRALEIKRDGANDSRRLLIGFGRVFLTPDLMYELTSDNAIIALGSPSLVKLHEVKARLVSALEDDWKKTSALIEAIGDPKPSNDQATKALEELANEGRAERDPPISRGKRQGTTYKWRRTENLTSDGTSYRSEVKLEAETSWEDVG
jgi:hypothetical protein